VPDTTTHDGEAPFISEVVRPSPLIVLSAFTLTLVLAGPHGAPMIVALGADAGFLAASVILRLLVIRDVCGRAQEDISTVEGLIRIRAHRTVPLNIIWHIEIIPKTRGQHGTGSTDVATSRDATGAAMSPDVLDGLPVSILKIAGEGMVISDNVSAQKLFPLGA